MKIILTESQYRRLQEVKGGHNKFTTSDFIKKAQETYTDEKGNPLYDYSLTDYKDSKTKVKVICPKHRKNYLDTEGQEYFEVNPSKHLAHQGGCRFDYKESKQIYSDKELRDEALKYKTFADFKLKSPSQWNSAHKRGKEFYKDITSHLVSGTQFAGEELTAEILVDENLINPSCLGNRNCENREKMFQDCTNTKTGRYCRPLRFDFFIPEMNTIIEYDGEQHFRSSTKYGGEKFETTQKNDKIKNQYCLKKGINLIRIHYRHKASKIKDDLLRALKNPKPITLIGNYN
jgi:very-short-patch-repair endonuclease